MVVGTDLSLLPLRSSSSSCSSRASLLREAKAEVKGLPELCLGSVRFSLQWSVTSVQGSQYRQLAPSAPSAEVYLAVKLCSWL